MKHTWLLLPLFCCLCVACSDSISLGSDIVTQGDVEVVVEDLEVPVTLVMKDRVISNSSNQSSSLMMVGNLNDEEYGQSSATAYFNASLLTGLPEDIENATLDSVVMILRYDTLGRYGMDRSVHDLELYELVETLDITDGDTLFTTDGFELQPDPIWTGTRTVGHTDSLDIQEYLADTMIRVVPELRIPLDNSRWFDVLTEDDTLDNTLLGERVPGFALLSTSDNNSVIGLDLGFSRQTNNASRIDLFIENDTAKTILRIPLGQDRQNQILHDKAGSAVGGLIGQPGGECLYLQSQGESEIQLDLGFIRDVPAFVINQATLEFTIIEPENMDFGPPPEITAVYTNEIGEELTVIDAVEDFRFGGSIEESNVDGEMVRSYVLDITRHLGWVRDGGAPSDLITIHAVPRASRPQRVKIAGPDHPQFPFRMRVLKTIP